MEAMSRDSVLQTMI